MSLDNIIAALLIDPIKGCLVTVNIPRAIDARWHMLLDAEVLELVRVHLGQHGWHGIWIDDCGLLRKPDPYPKFRLTCLGADRPIAGYGLLTSLTDGGGGDIDNVRIASNQLAPMIWFEDWPGRLKPDDYMDQLLRLYLPWP